SWKRVITQSSHLPIEFLQIQNGLPHLVRLNQKLWHISFPFHAKAKRTAVLWTITKNTLMGSFYFPKWPGCWPVQRSEAQKSDSLPGADSKAPDFVFSRKSCCRYLIF